MDWKSREITHHYNLRSLKGPRLRSRTRDQRNHNDASTSNNHQEQSYQATRNTTHRRGNRLQHEERENRSQQEHRRDRSQVGHRSQHERRRDRNQQRGRMKSTRRAHRALSGTPSTLSNTPDDASDDIKCVICIDTVNETEMKRIRCGHSFHKKCCNNWLKVNNACPVCRTVVTPRLMNVDNPNRERVIDDTPISDIIYFFTLSVMNDFD